MATPQAVSVSPRASSHSSGAHTTDTASPQAVQQAMAGFVPPTVALLRTADRLATAPAYNVRTDSGWQSTSWQAYGAEVRLAARALLALNVRHGQAVAVLSFNCPQWAVTGFAAMAIGAMPAGIYWTSSTADVEHILRHSQAPVMVIDDAERLRRLSPMLSEIPGLEHIVLLKGSADGLSCGQKRVWDWSAFLDLATTVPESALQYRMGQLKAEDLGTLIYTSGTTGPAKAVALSQGNLWWTATTMQSTFAVDHRDRMISYLPLAHIAEQMGSMHNQAHAGFQVFYARSLEELGDHLKEVHPTVFFGVPRVWEKMQSAIETKLSEATGVKAVMARWALRVGRAWHAQDLAGKPVGPWLSLQKALAQRLIYQKVQAALGFDQARLLTSGAAPIAPESLAFFTGLNLVIRELYGQSEACGPSTLSLPGLTRIGSVGQALPGTDIRVAEDGELMVRGPHIFQGYLGQTAATAEALDDGWLRTGDLGHIDEDGFVYITGRKKDLIITSGGKNISPANIEAALMDTHLIEHAVVVGDRRNYLSALVSLDQAAVSAYARQHGLQGDAMTHPEVMKAVQADIDRVNERQARVAQIRKFALLPQALTIEGGELTPTMKVKRKVVIERHQALVDALYQD